MARVKILKSTKTLPISSLMKEQECKITTKTIAWLRQKHKLYTVLVGT